MQNDSTDREYPNVGIHEEDRPDFTPDEIMADATAGLEQAGFRHVRVGDEFHAEDDVPFGEPISETRTDTGIGTVFELHGNVDQLGEMLGKMIGLPGAEESAALSEKMDNDPAYRRSMAIKTLIAAVVKTAGAVSKNPLAKMLGFNEEKMVATGFGALMELGVTEDEIGIAVNEMDDERENRRKMF